METAFRITFSLVVGVLAGVMLAGSPRVGRAYTVVIFYIPAIIGSILVETLPFKNKLGLLFSYWVSGGYKVSLCGFK